MRRSAISERLSAIWQQNGRSGGTGMSSNRANEELTNTLLGEIQIIPAEKRTSLSFLRTGIAVFVLQLSVLSALIATSRYYDFAGDKPLIIPLLVLCAILVLLGFYLVVRAVIRILHYDLVIRKIKEQHSVLREFLD